MLIPTLTDYEDHSCMCTGKIQNPLAVHERKTDLETQTTILLKLPPPPPKKEKAQYI